MSIVHIPISVERDPGPFPANRPCPDCGAYLNRSNSGPRCAPCQLAAMPDAEVIAEVLDLRARDYPDAVA